MRRSLLAVTILALALLAGASVRAQDADEAYRRGQALLEAGRTAEAAREFERVLELAERALGANDPRLAVDLNNLGEVYRRLGRYPEAAALLQRAIRLDEAAGGRSPALATSLNNLGLVYRAQGRLEEAAALHRRALGLLEGTLGPDHPDTARALANLAQVELQRGDAAAARGHLERAVAIAKASLGAEHATTRAIEAALSRTRGPADVRPATPPSPRSAATAAAPAAERATAPGPSGASASIPPGAPSAGATRAATAPPAGSAPAAAAPRGFRLHLGSIGDPARVEAEWQRLSRRHPSLQGLALLPAERVEVAGRGTFWRVIAGRVPTREAALELCQKVAAAGDPCTVLVP